MKVLVFGKTGQVAIALLRLSGEGIEITALGRDEADLSQPETCVAQIKATDADVIVNAAAYTAVDKAEEEEGLATVVNGEAPAAMARAAAARGIPFLHISTDYVFDGTGDKPHLPDDPTAPLNAYGRSKRIGEEGILAAGERAAILRTSWVFSAHGQNFVKTMLRLSETRDSLSIVGDQIGGPTPAREIAKALVHMAKAMLDGALGGVYHFAGQPETSWAGFAKEIFRIAGREITVSDIPTSAYPTPAKRPLNSRLDCRGLEKDFGIASPDWRRGLQEVMRDLGLKQDG